MALLSSRSTGREYAKGALSQMLGDQWSEKQNTGGGGGRGGGGGGRGTGPFFFWGGGQDEWDISSF